MIQSSMYSQEFLEEPETPKHFYGVSISLSTHKCNYDVLHVSLLQYVSDENKMRYILHTCITVGLIHFPHSLKTSVWKAL